MGKSVAVGGVVGVVGNVGDGDVVGVGVRSLQGFSGNGVTPLPSTCMDITFNSSTTAKLSTRIVTFIDVPASPSVAGKNEAVAISVFPAGIPTENALETP